MTTTALNVELATAGWQALHSGDISGASARFLRALALAPNDPVALTGMGAVYQMQGQLREAVLSCDAALAVAPRYAPGWLQRGFVLSAGGSMASAQQCFEQVVRLHPDNAQALAALAGLMARSGDAAAGRSYAARALARDPSDAVATCALARIEIEAGEAAAAAERLAALPAAVGAPSEQRVTMLTLYGDALDRLGRTDDAFAAYERANAAFVATHANRSGSRPETHAAFIARIADGVGQVDISNWALPETNPAPFANHVFLLGYPRSGTTLVENILASAPGVVALEERPTLRESDQAFLSPGGIDRLVALDAFAARRFRAAYWEKVASSTARAVGTTFVDMDPLKGIRLPIIARLFPNARIVIMRRDPRDVVWSCFRTDFALTRAAMDFATLEGAARHYDALMRLTQISLARLPLNAHVVRYDGLVHDFDGTTQALCAFLGLAWSSDLRDFSKTAQMRGVATASGGQVRKPLYDGTRQWERYARHLAPVIPTLQPWVDRFGFER